MSPLTRRAAMLKALEDAGPRGVTRRELASVGGTKWQQHLTEIEDGYYLRGHRSRFSSQIWRWVLVGERLPEPAGEACEIPPQLALITPSGRPAVETTASQRVDGTGPAPVAPRSMGRAA